MLHRLVRRTVNLYRKERLAALIVGVLVAQAHHELVRTGEVPGRKLIVFLPAGTGGATRLPIEETAFGSFEQQTIRIVALRSDVSVKALVAELRIQQASLADDKMMLNVDLIAALMKIRRRRLRRKGVKDEEVELLRIDRKRNRSRLLRSEDEVELRVGIETLEFRITRQRWKAVHRRTHKAVFKGLGNGDAILHDRPGERHAWCGGANANDHSVPNPLSGYALMVGNVKLILYAGHSRS